MPDREPEVVATRSLRSTALGLGRPSVRTTFQLAARLLPRDDQQAGSMFQDAVREALGWLRGKCPGDLPEGAWRGEPFECGVPGHSIEAISIPDDGIWSVRLIHPDAPFGDRPAVPGRTWTTEIAFRDGQDQEGMEFGIRVLCASQAYSTEEIALTRPRLVLRLAQQFILKKAREIDGRPIRLRSESDLDALHMLLADSERVLPVLLLTEADPRHLPGEVSPYILDPDDLGRKVEGLAYVATMPAGLTFAWTDRVGKVWSAYHGAVRTYQPGLDFDEDSPTEHPLALAKNIVFWRHNGLTAEDAFSAFLIEQVHQYGAAKRVDWGGCLFFADAQTYSAKKAREASNDERELMELYKKEVAALEQKVDELQRQSEAYNDDAMQSERDRDVYIEENKKLRHRIDALQAALEAKTGESVDATLEIPDSYDDLPDWVSENLAGRLTLHPRALRGISDAQYEDVGLVYQALMLLANEYKKMRLGYDGAREAFEKRLGDLGLRKGQSITENRAGEEGDTYYVGYPLHTQRKCFLEYHLRKGSTKDDRHCLAIYFFWDDDTREVVVGWLPSHLENRMT